MIELEERGAVTILRMVAGKGNALNLEFTQALDECVQKLERSPAKAVVLTGHGSVFGAGVDLPALVSGGPDYVRRFVPVMVAGFERLVTFPKPLVAAVNGHAIAGGAIIMLACDQKILAKGKARVGLTENPRRSRVSLVGARDREVPHAPGAPCNADFDRSHLASGGSPGARIGRRTGRCRWSPRAGVRSGRRAGRHSRSDVCGHQERPATAAGGTGPPSHGHRRARAGRKVVRS